MVNIELIERMRNDLNISQIDFSRYVGIAYTTYQRRLRKNDFKIEEVQSIASYLKVKPEEIMQERQYNTSENEQINCAEEKVFYGQMQILNIEKKRLERIEEKLDEVLQLLKNK